MALYEGVFFPRKREIVVAKSVLKISIFMKRNDTKMSARPGPLKDGWFKAAKYIHRLKLLFCVSIPVKRFIVSHF